MLIQRNWLLNQLSGSAPLVRVRVTRDQVQVGSTRDIPAGPDSCDVSRETLRWVAENLTEATVGVTVAPGGVSLEHRLVVREEPKRRSRR